MASSPQHQRGLRRDGPQASASGSRGDRAEQALTGPLDAIHLACGQRLLAIAARTLDVDTESPQAGAGDPAAEPRGGRLLEPVRLVEDHRVVLGQNAAPGGEVREVERVVGDHEVGLPGALAGRLGEAVPDERAPTPGTAVAPDGELGPERLGRLDLELGPVAGLGLVEPRLHRLPRAPVAAVGQQRRLEAVQLAAAEVVLAALDHRHRYVTPECGSRERDVVAKQLLLKRLGRGGHHDPQPRLERGQEIGEALADAGAGLGDEVPAGRER